jgi:hypothetical protein
MEDNDVIKDRTVPSRPTSTDIVNELTQKLKTNPLPPVRQVSPGLLGTHKVSEHNLHTHLTIHTHTPIHTTQPTHTTHTAQPTHTAHTAHTAHTTQPTHTTHTPHTAHTPTHTTHTTHATYTHGEEILRPTFSRRNSGRLATPPGRCHMSHTQHMYHNNRHIYTPYTVYTH